MHTNQTISVVIPTYNAAPYLRRCIDSVLSQSFKPLEILLIDDGSTDNTREIAKSYGKSIQYIYKLNGGASAARNTGIDISRGDWVAFLDVDDEWRCHHLENAINILQSHPELKWYGASANQYINESGKLIAEYKEKKPGILINNAYFEDYMVAFPPYAHFSTPTMIIHRSIFHKVGMFSENLNTGEDLEMWYRIALLFPRVGYCHEVAANIYKRSTSLSHTKKQDFRKNLATFKKRELMAESLGEAPRCRAEPRIMYWVTKLLKACLSRGDTTAVREIFSIYKHRISIRWYWFTRIYLISPWAIHSIFALRNIITTHNRHPKKVT